MSILHNYLCATIIYISLSTKNSKQMDLGIGISTQILIRILRATKKYKYIQVFLFKLRKSISALRITESAKYLSIVRLITITVLPYFSDE